LHDKPRRIPARGGAGIDLKKARRRTFQFQANFFAQFAKGADV